MTFKAKSISQRMSLIKGILSEVDTSDLIDQHQKLTSIIKGTGVALQSGTERRSLEEVCGIKPNICRTNTCAIKKQSKKKKKKRGLHKQNDCKQATVMLKLFLQELFIFSMFSNFLHCFSYM